MKIENTKMLIAVFTALNLVFLQVVPAGVAANMPADQREGTGGSAPAQSVTNAQAQLTLAPVPASATQTTTQFMSSSSVLPAAGTPTPAPATPVATTTLTVTKTLPPPIQTYVTALQNDKGTPELEKDLPPMVQAFADQLGEVLKGGMYVVGKPVLQADGTYRMAITHSPTQGWLGLTDMSFVLTAEGQMDKESIKVRYAIKIRPEDGVDFVNPNGTLLFEAMRACPQGRVCTRQVVTQIDALKKMTQVTVVKVKHGAIFYSLGGINYKAYRDAKGKVVLTLTTSPLQLTRKNT